MRTARSNHGNTRISRYCGVREGGRGRGCNQHTVWTGGGLLYGANWFLDWGGCGRGKDRNRCRTGDERSPRSLLLGAISRPRGGFRWCLWCDRGRNSDAVWSARYWLVKNTVGRQSHGSISGPSGKRIRYSGRYGTGSNATRSSRARLQTDTVGGPPRRIGSQASAWGSRTGCHTMWTL